MCVRACNNRHVLCLHPAVRVIHLRLLLNSSSPGFPRSPLVSSHFRLTCAHLQTIASEVAALRPALYVLKQLRRQLALLMSNCQPFFPSSGPGRLRYAPITLYILALLPATVQERGDSAGVPWERGKASGVTRAGRCGSLSAGQSSESPAKEEDWRGRTGKRAASRRCTRARGLAWGSHMFDMHMQKT